VRYPILALGLCLLPVAVGAQALADADGPEAVMTAMDDCWAKRDADCLAAHVTDDLVYTNATGSHWRSKAARQGWQALLASDMAAFPQTEERLVRRLGPDTAIVWERGRLSGLKTPDGKALPPMQTFGTMTMVRRGGIWLLAAGQTLLVPQPSAP